MTQVIKKKMTEEGLPNDPEVIEQLLESLETCRKDLITRNVKFSDMTEEEQIISDPEMMRDIQESLEVIKKGVRPWNIEV